MLDHLFALVEEHKRDIGIIYSELKLRLPSYLKSATIEQLRKAGATIDPDISVPRGTEDYIQKYVSLTDKIRETEETFKTQVIDYYKKVKKDLPKEILNKRMEDLNEEEWALLGINL